MGLAGGSGAVKISGHLLPSKDGTGTEWNLGSIIDSDTATSGIQMLRWNNLYLSGDIGATTAAIGTVYATNLGSTAAPVTNAYITNLGSTAAPVTNAYITNLHVNGNDVTSLLPSTTGTTEQFWRGDATWSNILTSTLILSATTDASETANNAVALVIGNRSGQHLELDGNEILSKSAADTMSTLYLNGTRAFKQVVNDTTLSVFTADRVYNAVFNDYAECRSTIDLSAGHVVVDNDDGTLSCSSIRLQPGAQVISDTYGNLMGETETTKTPIAVAGRVLVYPYQPRENYHAGMAVCSAPNGTVDIMTREEIRDYPDCIIGIVSEIPQYEVWGSDNVKVDGRIWIKVK